MLNGLRQKPEPSVNSTNAPPWSFAECSNERPSSITTTRAPAPHSDAQSSCRVTDLPDPDLPKTATLWRSEEHTSELQSLIIHTYCHPRSLPAALPIGNRGESLRPWRPPPRRSC